MLDLLAAGLSAEEVLEELPDLELDEALRIATRGSMRLHEADCHLESSRLALATGDRDRARKAWETAKAMIEEMGYHRRDGEVAELAQQLALESEQGGTRI